jgi:hypothetical protein
VVSDCPASWRLEASPQISSSDATFVAQPEPEDVLKELIVLATDMIDSAKGSACSGMRELPLSITSIHLSPASPQSTARSNVRPSRLGL